MKEEGKEGIVKKIDDASKERGVERDEEMGEVEKNGRRNGRRMREAEGMKEINRESWSEVAQKSSICPKVNGLIRKKG